MPGIGIGLAIGSHRHRKGVKSGQALASPILFTIHTPLLNSLAIVVSEYDRDS